MKKFLSLLVAMLILVGMVGCSAKKTTDQNVTGPVAKGQLPTLTAEEAQAIALEHAGVTADQVTSLNARYQVTDYVPEYIVAFEHDELQYNYTIHGDSGEVLVYGTNPIGTPEAKPKLSQNAVRDIAVKHSGINGKDVQNLEIEYAVFTGEPVYLVKFRVGSAKLKYIIHAETGEILSNEKERVEEEK